MTIATHRPQPVSLVRADAATDAGPHGGRPAWLVGTPLADASAAVILVHGRGAGAGGIIGLADEFRVTRTAWLAPDAMRATWYPARFVAPVADNEPWLSSALVTVDDAVATVRAAGIPAERTVLMGFSQGACLALEYAARHATRYGGVIAYAGGLIGPDGTPRDYAGALDGTPVFLGVGDRDHHIPVARVQESADVLARLGGDVDMRVYEGLPHTIVPDQIAAGQAILDRITADG